MIRDKYSGSDDSHCRANAVISVTNPNNQLHKLAGRRVTVMGLGRFGGGLGAVEFLTRAGAVVSVTDQRPADQLSDSLAKIQHLSLHELELGQHSERLITECDLLVVNPAVKPSHPLIAAARQQGIEVTTEIDIFCQLNPARTIAVTGSNGKSTTTALIHHLLQPELAAAGRRVWLGGNIGGSLLSDVHQIQADDWVILELSSFQLEYLRPRKFRPEIAVITNLSPNHLDWHGTFTAYHRAKQGILDGQLRTDLAVLPAEEHDSAEIGPWKPRGRVLRFGVEDAGEDGCFITEGLLILRSSSQPVSEDAFRFRMPSQLPGVHNQLNFAAAACAAWQAGANAESFEQSASDFQPLPHRLQLVAEGKERRFYNDSIATTPESAIQALRVFGNAPDSASEPSVVVLAGGYDKHQDLGPFAAELCQHARHVVLMGQTAIAIHDLLVSLHSFPAERLTIAHDFGHAFSAAVANSRAGDIVLLSPGCASWGWFRDFRERGDLFMEMAKQWCSVN